MWGRIFKVPAAIFSALLIWAAPVSAAEKVVDVEFLTKNITVRYDDALVNAGKTYFTEDAPEQFYNDMEQLPYKPLLLSLIGQKYDLQLNDWLYYNLVKKTSDKIFEGANANYRTMAAWYLMAKTGYRVKLLYNRKNAYIFVHTADMVLEMPYIENDEGRFINISSYTDKSGLSLNKLYDAELGYRPAGKSFEFKVNELPVMLKPEIVDKTLRFPHDGKVYSINVKADKNILRYLRNYPKLEPEVWATTPLSATAYNSLIPAFKKYTDEMEASEAVRFILSFTRQAFAYATDQEAYKEDNVAFAPELTLLSPYSDCEDRAILFSYLVKELVGLDVILLEFPTHVSAAVNLPETQGKPIYYKGKAYTFCEPTGPQNHLALGEYPSKYQVLSYKIMDSAK